MPTLIVQPIDLSAPGSYRERKRYIRLVKRLRETAEANDADAVLALLEEAESLIISRLRTEDDSPVEDALDGLSANQFDQLLSQVAFTRGVGEASAAPSTTGTEVADVMPPIG